MAPSNGETRSWSLLLGVLPWLVLVGFAAMCSAAVQLAPRDAGLYLVMARQLAEGHLPYRDFFFSHPLLHLIPASLIFALRPEGWMLATAVPVAAATATGALLWSVARRWSPTAGLIAVVLWCTADAVVIVSAEFVGLACGMLLFAAALAAEAASRWRLAGAMVALCVLTSTLVGLVAISWLAAVLLLDRRRIRDAAAVAAAVLVVAAAGCWLAFGPAFFDQVYLSPLHRPSGAGGVASRLRTMVLPFLLQHPSVWLAALLVCAGAARHGWRTSTDRAALDTGGEGSSPLASAGVVAPRTALAWAIAVGAILVFLSLFGSVHAYYTVVCMPPLVLLAAAGWVQVGRLAAPSSSGSTPAPVASSDAALPPARAAARPGARVALIALVSLILLAIGSGWGTWHRFAMRTAYQQQLGVRLEAVAAVLDATVVVEARLFGDSNVAPLLALAMPRNLWHQLADTNTKRFRADPEATATLVAELQLDPPEVVILLERHGVALLPSVAAFVRAHYPPPFAFDVGPVDHLRIFVRPAALRRP